MKSDERLPEAVRKQIAELKISQKLTLPVGSNPEYFRIQAKINYLRHGSGTMKVWREKNASRIKYERAVGIAYRSGKPKKDLTPEQRIARNAAVTRHTARNPQRRIRQNLERTLHHLYRECREGQIKKRRPRAEALLGCTTFQFREHIRVLLALKDWLWSGWKTVWTIDHIVPVRKFDLPREQFACWHYTNLRPLAKGRNHKDQRG